jgi:lipoate-protein ligase A
VRRALARLGVELERNDRGDLYLAGKKVSGNAMCYRKDAVLHHGTLLISADLDKLAEAIAASSLDIETHAVASVRAKVCNISDLHPEVDIDGVSAALAAELEESYEGRSATSAERLPAVDGRRLAELQERNTSWEWIFGRTPSFEAAFPVFSASGTGTVRIRVQKGTVRGIQTSDHALEAKLWDAFNAERFDPEAIRAFLDRKE